MESSYFDASTNPPWSDENGMVPWMSIRAGGTNNKLGGLQMYGDLDMQHHQILNWDGGGGGGGPTEMIEVTYKPFVSGSLIPPEYNAWNDVTSLVASNHSKGLTTRITVSDEGSAGNPINIPTSDLSHSVLVGNQAGSNPVSINFTGIVSNLREIKNFWVTASDPSYGIHLGAEYDPRLLIDYVSFRNPTSVVNIGPDSQTPTVELVETKSANLTISTGDGNIAVRIGRLSRLLSSSSKVTGGGHFIVQLTADAASASPTSDTVPPAQYSVDTLGNADDHQYFDTAPAMVLHPKFNNPTTQEAIDSLKLTVTRVYCEPALTQSRFPFYKTFDEVFQAASQLVAGSPDTQVEIHLILEPLTPLQVPQATYDAHGRIALVGNHAVDRGTQILLLTDYADGAGDVLKNFSRFEHLVITAGTIGINVSPISCLAVDSSYTPVLTFKDCLITMGSQTHSPLISLSRISVTAHEPDVIFDGCELSNTNDTVEMCRQLSGTPSLEFRDSNITTNIVVDQPGYVIMYGDVRTPDAYHYGSQLSYELDTWAKHVFYSHSDNRVPAPPIPDNVTVKDILDWTKTLVPPAFVYRPGSSVNDGQVFDDFAKLQAATLQNRMNAVVSRIIMDDSIQPCILPASSFALDFCVFVGYRHSIMDRTQVTLQAGTSLINLQGLMGISLKVNGSSSGLFFNGPVTRQFTMHSAGIEGLDSQTMDFPVFVVSAGLGLYFLCEYGSALPSTTRQGSGADHGYISLGGGSGTVILAVTLGSTVDNSVFYGASPGNNLLLYTDVMSTTFTSLAFPANITFLANLPSKSENIYHATSSVIVPTPVIANVVTVKEELDALKNLQVDNSLLTYNKLTVSGGAGTVANISAEAIGLYGAPPVVQQVGTGVAPSGFVAGTSGIVDDSATYDGGIGATRYTVGEIVRFLKLKGDIAM